MAFTVTVGGTVFTNANLDGTAYADEAAGFAAMIQAVLREVRDSWKGTSTTSLSVSTGNKSLTIEAARHFAVGAPCRIARTSNPAGVFMDGTVTAYDSTTGAMTVNVTAATGSSGPFTDWTVGLGTMVSVSPGATPVPISIGGTGATTAAGALANLGGVDAASVFLKSGNLSGIVAATGRANLGLGTMATEAATDYLTKAGNLSGIADASIARGNLGLGTAAPLNVGTAANNVVQLTAAAKLPAVDGSLLTNLPAGPIPGGGTVPMWFYLSAAPAGWTRITSVTDRVLRVMSSGGGNIGGNGSWPIDDLTVTPFTLLLQHIPSHSHGVGDTQSIGAGSGGQNTIGINAFGGYDIASESVGGGQAHGHGITSSGTYRPPTVDGLLASKN